jgi:hypothetical protein
MSSDDSQIQDCPGQEGQTSLPSTFLELGKPAEGPSSQTELREHSHENVHGTVFETLHKTQVGRNLDADNQNAQARAAIISEEASNTSGGGLQQPNQQNSPQHSRQPSADAHAPQKQNDNTGTILRSNTSINTLSLQISDSHNFETRSKEADQPTTTSTQGNGQNHEEYTPQTPDKYTLVEASIPRLEDSPTKSPGGKPSTSVRGSPVALSKLEQRRKQQEATLAMGPSDMHLALPQAQTEEPRTPRSAFDEMRFQLKSKSKDLELARTELAVMGADLERTRSELDAKTAELVQVSAEAEACKTQAETCMREAQALHRQCQNDVDNLCAKEIARCREQCRQAIEACKRQCEELLALEKKACADQIEECRENCDREMEGYYADCQSEIARVKVECEAEKVKIRRECDSEMEVCKRMCDMESARCKEETAACKVALKNKMQELSKARVADRMALNKSVQEGELHVHVMVCVCILYMHVNA